MAEKNYSDFSDNFSELNETIFGRNASFLANTSTTDVIPYETRPETYIIPFVFALIFIIGVIGNGTLIIVFLRHRSMSTIPNT